MMTAVPAVPKRPVTMLFRRARELGGSRASWARVEPGPTRARTWGALCVYLFWAACVVGMIGWGAALVRGVVRWENLRSRGENATASVVYTWYTGNDDDGHRYYLDTHVEACDCDLVVRVRVPDGHPSGSAIPVRFDPRDHSNVVPRVDRPADWLGVAIVFYIAISVTATVLAAMWLRARQQRKALLRSAAGARAVKFRTWRRTFGNSNVNYLMLYDASTPAWDEPLCCVPVFTVSLRKIRADDVLMLHGSAMHGSAALRRERTIIVPSGPVKPGRWEQALRLG